jgi:hypothetical protein
MVSANSPASGKHWGFYNQERAWQTAPFVKWGPVT